MTDDGSRPMRALIEHANLRSVPLASSRRGVGTVLTTLRRAVARLLVPVLHQQTAFNRAVVVEMDEATLRTTRLESAVGRLEVQLMRLEARADGTPLVSASGDSAPPPVRESTVVDRFAMQQCFRGSEEAIKQRQRVYLDHFPFGGRVLDVGCGRGEFLELLRARGARAQGVDDDLENARHCWAKGLDVVHGDAFGFLERFPDGSLDGVFCAQFVEHFPPARVLHLVNLVARKLVAGGVAVFETPNPQCLAVFAQAFYLDFTHVWPYHPEAMTFVMEAAGFTGVRVVFSSPIDPEARFPALRDPSVFGKETDSYNRAATLVNRLLLGPQDYAVIGRKGAGGGPKTS